jgi:hypothetical protein
MTSTRDYHVKWDKPSSERQILNVFIQYLDLNKGNLTLLQNGDYLGKETN